jgi:uncharacterized protein
MHPHTKRLIKLILGIFLIFIGIIGLFLPLLQGILFIIAGVLLVQNKSWSDVKEYIRQKKEKIKKKLVQRRRKRGNL